MTNEQRAHDIAIAMIPISLAQANAEAVANPDRKLSVDVIDIYMKIYTKSLEALNEKLPNEQ